MKALYIAAAVLGVAVLARKRAQSAKVPEVRVGSLGEGVILDGTNWTGHVWDRMTNASDLTLCGAEGNASGCASAHFGQLQLANARLVPGWDGGVQ